MLIIKLKIYVCILSLSTTISGQTPFYRLYWGDEYLDNQYDISTNPPYEIDTTSIVGYQLPFNLNKTIDQNEIKILALFKNRTNLQIQELAIYQQNVMTGFFLKYNENGKLIKLFERPSGLVLSFVENEIVEVSNLSDAESGNIRVVLEKSKKTIEIELEINNVRHIYIISLNGEFVKQKVKKGDEFEYFILWSL
ncbi:MAG: hypothetical protein PHT69_05260 [Bacteroidales bacterium]|nr:hypothetical protein [Bacteroidales bacterium]